MLCSNASKAGNSTNRKLAFNTLEKMKYYLIAGEASGDLHASRLMKALKETDKEAEFRFFGGDKMAAEGGVLVKHYKDLAYMGFVPVLLHLPTIFRNMAFCKRDIRTWNPDAVILIDYPGFNLSIAKHVRAHTKIPVYYYISPKIWAWKEYRIRSIKRDVDEMFCILPFEVPFYEGKHRFPVHYVGNPTAEEVALFKASYTEHRAAFCERNHLNGKPIIALLAGSRRQEIKDNLPAMIAAASRYPDYQPVIAGVSTIERTYYERFMNGCDVPIVYNETYPLLSHAVSALVTSGTATLETALFNVPQVVCYETPIPHLIRFAFHHIIKVKYISLVNLIADCEIVPELLADRFSMENIANELERILPDHPQRAIMLQAYREVQEKIGHSQAPYHAANIMVRLLHATQNKE